MKHAVKAVEKWRKRNRCDVEISLQSWRKGRQSCTRMANRVATVSREWVICNGLHCFVYVRRFACNRIKGQDRDARGTERKRKRLAGRNGEIRCRWKITRFMIARREWKWGWRDNPRLPETRGVEKNRIDAHRLSQLICQLHGTRLPHLRCT